MCGQNASHVERSELEAKNQTKFALKIAQKALKYGHFSKQIFIKFSGSMPLGPEPPRAIFSSIFLKLTLPEKNIRLKNVKTWSPILKKFWIRPWHETF